MIVTDKVSSIDSKDEIKTNNEGNSNISIKSRTKNTLNKEDTRGIVEMKKFLGLPLKNISELLVVKQLMSLVLRKILLRLNNCIK